jgi:ankyrin repeat protein
MLDQDDTVEETTSVAEPPDNNIKLPVFVSHRTKTNRMSTKSTMSLEGRARLLAFLDRRSEAPLDEVRTLVEAEPELLKPMLIVNNVGDSALHTSIRNGCPDAVILFLLRGCPDAAKLVDLAHNLPLMSALNPSSSVSVQVILELHDVFPGCLQRTDHCSPYGNLFFWALAERPHVARAMLEKHPELASISTPTCHPIHISAELNDRATVELLLEKYPAGLRKKDSKGLSPLHLIFRSPPMDESGSRMDLDLFSFLADKMGPEAFQTVDEETGRLFLHEISIGDIKYSMDTTATQAVIDRNPAAVMIPDKDGNLPVHLAVGDYDEAVVFVRTLIDASPECLKTPNAAGKLPLHVAAGRFMVSVMDDLIECYPEAIITKDANGQNPLHIMLDSDMFDRCNSQQMVELYPEALRMKDFRGRLPLHYALDDCQYFEAFDWREAIDLLTKEYPEAATVHDNDGRTPFHFAAALGTPLEVTKTLLERCPNAVFIPDREGNVPLILAATETYSRHEESRLSTIYLLLRHNPSRIMATADRICDGLKEQAPAPVSRKRKLSEAWYKAKTD